MSWTCVKLMVVIDIIVCLISYAPFSVLMFFPTLVFLFSILFVWPLLDHNQATVTTELWVSWIIMLTNRAIAFLNEIFELNTVELSKSTEAELNFRKWFRFKRKWFCWLRVECLSIFQSTAALFSAKNNLFSILNIQRADWDNEITNRTNADLCTCAVRHHEFQMHGKTNTHERTKLAYYLQVHWQVGENLILSSKQHNLGRMAFIFRIFLCGCN